MPESDHEEADTRMCLHVSDAIRKGARYVLVRTVDTDVIVILVGVFFELLKLNPNVQIWVAFGRGKNFRHYHINTICSEFGERKCRALPFFHAFTGSDTTSQFSGRAKKTSWEVWKSFPIATDGFAYPADHPFVPFTVDSPEFRLI